MSDVALEIGCGKGIRANAPIPMVLLLDLERALSALGKGAEAQQIARQLNGPEVTGNGHAGDAHELVTVVQTSAEPVESSCLGFKLGGPAYCVHGGGPKTR